VVLVLVAKHRESHILIIVAQVVGHLIVKDFIVASNLLGCGVLPDLLNILALTLDETRTHNFVVDTIKVLLKEVMI
jgi:hypothetical protein